MAITIDQGFITQFGAEVKAAYQLESQLYDVVRKRTDVIGTTSRFQKIGSVSAYQKARNADMTVLEPLHSYVDVTLADWTVSVMVDKFDEFKSNIDYKKEYVQIVAKSAAEKIDNIIITALAAGSATTTTNSGAMSLARLLEIKKYFDANKVPNKDRIVIVGSKTMTDMLGLTPVTSADFNTVKALVQGELDTYLGMKFITVPDSYLPLNATPTPDTRVNVAFHRDALGLAVGIEPKPFIEWSPDKRATWVGIEFSMGAGIVDPNGVVEFEVDI